MYGCKLKQNIYDDYTVSITYCENPQLSSKIYSHRFMESTIAFCIAGENIKTQYHINTICWQCFIIDLILQLQI